MPLQKIFDQNDTWGTNLKVLLQDPTTNFECLIPHFKILAISTLIDHPMKKNIS